MSLVFQANFQIGRFHVLPLLYPLLSLLCRPKDQIIRGVQKGSL
jgi:hypothetical protein